MAIQQFQPMDYTSGFASLPSPESAMLDGLKTGNALQAQQQAQVDREKAEAAKMQMNADLAALSQKPTAEAIGRMSLKYPMLSEQFKRSFDILEPGQKQTKIENASQVYSAVQSGKPEIAYDLLMKQAAAHRNSGDEKEAKAAETWATMAREHPDTFKLSAGMMLSSAIGPEKFAATYGGLGEEERADQQAAADLAKKTADAKKAGAEAYVAVNSAGSKVEQEAEAVKTAQDKRRIDQLNVEIGQADSETKRGQLILERDKLVASQATQGTEKGEGAQSQIDSAQHALDTITELRKSPLMNGGVGNSIAGMGTILGKLAANIPGTENKDFRGQLESLKSQVFLPAVQQVKGMGALSNAEGEKLTAAVAALDADMSPKAFKNAMGVVERYMTKGLQKGLANKSAPTQGGGVVMNHPKFGTVREGDINRLMKQNPGATRAQVLEYLNAQQQTGGASGDY